MHGAHSFEYRAQRRDCQPATLLGARAYGHRDDLRRDSTLQLAGTESGDERLNEVA